MAGASQRSFDKPDEQRTPDKTKVDVLAIGDMTYQRSTFQPGWRWSENVKPVAGTDSCQSRHVGAVVAGRIHVKHDDGTEIEAGPGDAYLVEPGHDAWTLGDETCVCLEISTSPSTYATPV
jgi:hypothetical protein